MANRSEINRALSKALAYVECGKQADAAHWTTELLAQLRNAGLPVPGADR